MSWLFKASRLLNYKPLNQRSSIMPAKGKGKYAHLGLGPMKVRDENGRQTSPIRVYRIWQNMMARGNRCPSTMRCDPNYLDLDTTVCDEWKDFGNFWRWAMSHGYRDDLSIDRIDNFKGYSPDNCRWATPTEQNINRRMTPKRLAANRRNLAKGPAASAEKRRLLGLSPKQLEAARRSIAKATIASAKARKGLHHAD